jgi:DNA-binding CsgD family transcriptional regulator
MYSETLLESLIQKIYEAAGTTAGWLSFLICLAGALDGGCPTFFLDDSSTRQGSVVINVGLEDKDLRAYQDYFSSRNVWLRRGSHLLRPGIVRSSDMMCPRREFLRSEWYADFCKPHNWTHGLGATIVQEGTVTSNFSLFADDSRPTYGEEDFALVRALMPHLRQGIAMQMHLAASKARGQALEAVLNRLNTPVLLVTAEAKVLFMNAAAEELIRSSDGLAIEDGILGALLPGDSKSLRALVAGAAQTSARRACKSGGRIRVSRPYNRQPLEILISPLPSLQDDWLLRQPPAAALFVTDRSRSPLAEGSALIGLHGLTAMEAKVAIAVSRGLSGKEICRELGISYNTLRTHLKHIYAKTQTRHLTDLLRVLAGGLRIVGIDDDAGSA